MGRLPTLGQYFASISTSLDVRFWHLKSISAERVRYGIDSNYVAMFCLLDLDVLIRRIYHAI